MAGQASCSNHHDTKKFSFVLIILLEFMSLTARLLSIS